MICKTETESSISDEAFLRAWAQARLERHCEPVVTITVSGLELAHNLSILFPLDQVYHLIGQRIAHQKTMIGNLVFGHVVVQTHT